MQTINNKITKIIQSRKIDNDIISKNEYEFEPLQLDELPSVMISSISSFLQFQDLLIFTGTRLPTSLHILSSLYSHELISCKENSNNFHWNRFKSITELHLNVDDFIESDDNYQTFKYKYKLNNINIPTWNDLQSLTIRNHDDNDCNDEFVLTEQFLMDILSLNLNNLKTIKIEAFIIPSVIFSHHCH